MSKRRVIADVGGEKLVKLSIERFLDLLGEEREGVIKERPVLSTWPRHGAAGEVVEYFGCGNDRPPYEYESTSYRGDI